MKRFTTFVVEGDIHPKAVHAHSTGAGKFKVEKVGAKVKHLKVGDSVSSSDLDDLQDTGHKVKEIKEDSNNLNEATHKVHISYEGKDTVHIIPVTAKDQAEAEGMAIRGLHKHFGLRSKTKIHKVEELKESEELKELQHMIPQPMSKITHPWKVTDRSAAHKTALDSVTKTLKNPVVTSNGPHHHIIKHDGGSHEVSTPSQSIGYPLQSSMRHIKLVTS